MANSNGWGDGASNNNIGWGQGATNNSIYWGYFHALSAAGLTDIVGQTFQPESVAYFTAIEDAGGTLTDNVKAEFDAFVVREKDAGRWDKYIALFPFLGGTLDGGIIDAKNLLVANKTGSNLVDADFGDVIGVTGDGATKRLDTTLIAANIFDSTADLQIGVFTGKQNTVNGMWIGAGNSTPATTMLWFNNTIAYYGNYQIIPKAVTDANDSSFIAFTGGQAFTMENGVAAAKLTPISYNLPTTSFGILTRRFNNSWSSGYVDGTINGAFFAKGMSESELTDFDTSYRTFVNNIITYAASQAYFSAVTASGGTLSANVQAEFTSFVSREVEAGRWSKIKRLYPFLGGKINSAVIDVVTTNAATNSNFVDADANATIGLQSDGSTKYLTDYQVWSNIISSQYKVTIGNFYGSGLNQENSNPYIYGSISGGNYIATRILSTSTIARSYVGLSSPFSQVAKTLLSNESVIATRLSNVYSATLVSGSTDLVDTSTTTYSIPANEPSYFKANGAGGISQGLSNGFFIAEFDTLQEVKDFETSYKTFITNITA